MLNELVNRASMVCHEDHRHNEWEKDIILRKHWTHLARHMLSANSFLHSF
jgi:hypothetical protein